MRLTRVDLPTFGRPTTASTGCPGVPKPAPPSASCPVSSSPASSRPATSKSSPISTQPSSSASMSVNAIAPCGSRSVPRVVRVPPPGAPALPLPLGKSLSCGAKPRTRSASAAVVPRARHGALAGEAGDLLDHLLKGQVGRVEQQRVGGFLRLRRVEAVPAGLGGLGLGRIGAQLSGPAAGARSRVGGQEDLERSVLGDDRADVTALGHDTRFGHGDDRTLLRDQVLADRGDAGHHTDLGGDLRCPDLAGDVLAVDAGPRVVRVGGDLDGRFSRALRDQVSARYIAPVSRYCRPSARATPMDALDLPEPDGPSMAMTRPFGEEISTQKWYREPSAALATEVTPACGRAGCAVDFIAVTAALALAFAVDLVLALQGLAELALGLVQVWFGGLPGLDFGSLLGPGGLFWLGFALRRGGLRGGGLTDSGRCRRLRGVLLRGFGHDG